MKGGNMIKDPICPYCTKPMKYEKAGDVVYYCSDCNSSFGFNDEEMIEDFNRGYWAAFKNIRKELLSAIEKLLGTD